MKTFMDKDFLLETQTAKHLFHDYAEHLPVVDYHCHIPAREIFEDRKFEDLSQVWLGGRTPEGTYIGDHYKWRLMRSNGVPEEYITGDMEGKQRMEKFAQALEMAIGSPIYHWCNLELRKFFGYEGHMSPDSLDEIWELTKDKLQNDAALTARGMIARFNVEMIGTTDDPIDSLEWHEKIAADPTISVKVLPSFRPDKAVNIATDGFADYIGKLAQSVGQEGFANIQELWMALSQRLECFAKAGCAASDHGLDYVPFTPCSVTQADITFKKAMRGEKLTTEEADGYRTATLLHLAREYHRLGIVMQIHYSCLRNVNKAALQKLGPDTGYDVIAQNSCGGNIAAMLSELEQSAQCPKTILYSLNPIDNAQIGTIIGSFQSDEIAAKIQHGSAWWFSDTKTGMIDQLTSLANLGVLGNFVGMLTDSRSFLSYARHDYFRRILCNLIGGWVENGEYPNDEKALKKIVEGICYKNALRYFGL